MARPYQVQAAYRNTSHMVTLSAQTYQLGGPKKRLFKLHFLRSSQKNEPMY